MFIIPTIPKGSATGEVLDIYTQMEELLGFLPPHVELFATLDLKGIQEFLVLTQYMSTHPRIDRNILVFLRYAISEKECKGYCTSFNARILTSMGVEQSILDNISENIMHIPLKKIQILLLQKVLKALFSSKEFSKLDIKELEHEGFNKKDFFDLLNYASIFMSKSKIIEAYLK